MPVILIVDDSAVHRHLVEKELTLHGGLDWLVEYAEDGVAALDILHDIRCDVVVTDLQMPKMNGLELVTQMRRLHPDIPAILFTGEGSESIALEALERGAASYVPKNQLHEKLVGTIQQVIATSRASILNRHLFRAISNLKIEFELKNDSSLIRPLVDYVEEILTDIGFCDHADRVHMGVALEEALMNAIFHGNLELSGEQVQAARALLSEGKTCDFVDRRCEEEPYRDRCVKVGLSITPAKAKFVVRDEGIGFPDQLLPERANPVEIQSSHGRGLVLIQNFMDEVKFNEKRDQITLVKHNAALS